MLNYLLNIQAGTANPTQPTNLYANIVNAEADILSTPENGLNIDTVSESKKNIPENVTNKEGK